jgi:hypothetical protein
MPPKTAKPSINRDILRNSHWPSHRHFLASSGRQRRHFAVRDMVAEIAFDFIRLDCIALCFGRDRRAVNRSRLKLRARRINPVAKGPCVAKDLDLAIGFSGYTSVVLKPQPVPLPTETLQGYGFTRPRSRRTIAIARGFHCDGTEGVARLMPPALFAPSPAAADVSRTRQRELSRSGVAYSSGRFRPPACWKNCGKNGARWRTKRENFRRLYCTGNYRARGADRVPMPAQYWSP